MLTSCLHFNGQDAQPGLDGSNVNCLGIGASTWSPGAVGFSMDGMAIVRGMVSSPSCGCGWVCTFYGRVLGRGACAAIAADLSSNDCDIRMGIIQHRDHSDEFSRHKKSKNQKVLQLI